MSDDVRLSKMLSLWLRHQPEEAGLTLDPQGWTDVDDALAALARADFTCDWLRLLRVVDESDKQRFELSCDAARIRARQGHSVVVDLGWPQVCLPNCSIMAPSSGSCLPFWPRASVQCVGTMSTSPPTRTLRPVSQRGAVRP